MIGPSCARSGETASGSFKSTTSKRLEQGFYDSTIDQINITSSQGPTRDGRCALRRTCKIANMVNEE